MPDSQLADLDLKTIISLTGMPPQKDIINPRDSREMAQRVKVTFRPLPNGYNNETIIRFRKILEEKLKHSGVQVVPWKEATEITPGSFFSKVLRIRKVRHRIHAVIDVDRPYSPIRKLMSNFAEWMYSHLRSPDMAVMEILKRSGWADDFTAKYVQDPYNTQIITLMPLDPEFADESTNYDRKINIGLQNLIRTMSEIVIGVSEDKYSIINMNLSDSTFSNQELDKFIVNSLIPKMYAPIQPPVLNRFERGEYDPDESPYARQLVNLGKQLKDTDLFPSGSKFSERITRLSHRDVVEKILEGRTGVSYGFIAVAEEPKYYDGPKEITQAEWDALLPVDGQSNNTIRQNDKSRWYVRTKIRGKEIYQQVPDIWVVTSRSGCDKTNLDPKGDVVRIGLIKGKLYLQTPYGVNLNRRDIRPSFDTYVILSQAISAALYLPELIQEGMPIVHFHGYPNPEWFNTKECYAGAQNPSMPCGTIEAALLNYSGIYELANLNGGDMELLCLVEADHGVNILGPSSEYLVMRLMDGSGRGHILLGGKYLPLLRNNSKREFSYLAAK
ncbi:MAG TPA: hypothetical protein VHT73_03760 [Thermodesulfobacteriota bacterium]|nr:hypothetical protein [Thermodesulfobacteriota bacterium]